MASVCTADSDVILYRQVLNFERFYHKSTAFLIRLLLLWFILLSLYFCNEITRRIHRITFIKAINEGYGIIVVLFFCETQGKF